MTEHTALNVFRSRKLGAVALSALLVFPAGTAPACAYAAGENGASGYAAVASDTFTEADRNALVERINALRKTDLHADEQPGVSLNAQEITVDVDSLTSGESDIVSSPTYQLELSANGRAVSEGVKWYCYTAYPENVYLPSELQAAFDKNASDPTFKPDNNIAAFVDENGLVTGKVSRGSLFVTAEYDGHLYPCLVKVRDGADTRKMFAEQKTDKIIRERGIDVLPTRAEKVLAVHDFLASTIEYDKKYTQGYYEYNALFLKKAVCRGYARTFKMFMNHLNIPCEYRSGDQEGSAHAWDIVQMDDSKWYYVDATQDRMTDGAGNFVKVGYRKLLADRQTFLNWQYALDAEMPEGEDGTEFLCYAYKRADAFAQTESELQRIVNFQLNAARSAGKDAVRFEVAVPKDFKSDNQVNAALKAWQPDLSARVSYTDLGSYYLADCEVSEIKPASNPKEYGFVSAEDVTENDASTSEVKLTFSEPVDGLTKDDLRVTGAKIDSLSPVGNGVYLLKVKDISVPTGSDLTIEVAKNDCSFAPQRQTVTATAITPDPENPTDPDPDNPGGSTDPDPDNLGGTTDPDPDNPGGTTDPDPDNPSPGGSTDSSKPDPDPDNPGGSTDPDPDNPGGSVDPDPNSPDPGESTDPSKPDPDPDNPGGSADPDKPTEPADQSSGSGQATKPATPGQSANPGTPNASAASSAGSSAASSSQPTASSKPSTSTATSKSALKKQRDKAAKAKMKSMKLKLKAAKKGRTVKLTWKKSISFKPDYYQVLRSKHKNSGYGKKPIATTKKCSLTNRKGLKKGKTYYYKVRAVKKIGGKKVYSRYSAKAKVAI